MPEMDGVEVIKEVRRTESPNPPYIILFTVRDEKKAIIEGLNAGANDYVTKPFDKDEFRARIRVGERFIQMQNTLAEKIARFTGGADPDPHPAGYHSDLHVLP